MKGNTDSEVAQVSKQSDRRNSNEQPAQPAPSPSADSQLFSAELKPRRGKASDDADIQGQLVTFTELLVVVGFLQFFALVGQVVIYCRQAKIMARQAHEMKRSRSYMRLQWKAMGVQAGHMEGQLAQMSVQSGILQESVGVARAAAKAAQDGANAAKASADATRDSVETFISKERARLRITPLPFKPDFSTVTTFVQYSICFYGNADAFISQSAAYAIVSPFKAPNIDDERARIFKIGLPDVISSATDLSPRHMVFAYRDEMEQLPFDLLVAAINEARAFVHFYAFIKYRTLDTDRETRVCLTWEVNPAINALIGKPVDHWEKSGAAEANRET